MTEINKILITDLFDKAVINPRLRQNYDLRNLMTMVSAY